MNAISSNILQNAITDFIYTDQIKNYKQCLNEVLIEYLCCEVDIEERKMKRIQIESLISFLEKLEVSTGKASVLN